MKKLLYQYNPWWEGESCAGDPGTSNLYGEKKVYIDDINKYIIKANLVIDDNSWVWINNQEVTGLHRECCGWTDWEDVTSYFNTGENHIKFRAEDTCSGDRYFLKLSILPSVSFHFSNSPSSR